MNKTDFVEAPETEIEVLLRERANFKLDQALKNIKITPVFGINKSSRNYQIIFTLSIEGLDEGLYWSEYFDPETGKIMIRVKTCDKLYNLEYFKKDKEISKEEYMNYLDGEISVVTGAMCDQEFSDLEKEKIVTYFKNHFKKNITFFPKEVVDESWVFGDPYSIRASMSYGYFHTAVSKRDFQKILK